MSFIITYLLYNLIFVLDMWDVLLRLYWRMRYIGPRQWKGDRILAYPTSASLDLPYMPEEEKKRHLKPFAILVSVFNAEGYIRVFLEKHRPYLSNFLIIDDCSTDRTYRVLEEMGIRYIRNETNMKKPASIKRGLGCLQQDIETVIVMDPDSYIVESGMNSRITDMEEVLSDFQRSGADGCAVRINLEEGKSIISRLQELEYMVCLSLGRKSLLDKTVLSGIAIYKRSSLEDAMEGHQLSVYGEDLMTSLIILNNGGSVYYDGRLLVKTEGKPDLKGLASQRTGWDFGYIMVYLSTLCMVIRRELKSPLLLKDRRIPLFYNYFVYLGVFGMLFHPVKLISITILTASLVNLASVFTGLPLLFDNPVFSPFWFLFFYTSYCALTLAMITASVQNDRRGRYWPVIPVYPFYAIFLLLVRTTGFMNYLTVLTLGKKLYHDHY